MQCVCVSVTALASPSNIIYNKKRMFAVFFNCICTWFGWFAFAQMKKASTAWLCSSALTRWEIRHTSLWNTWCKKRKVFHEGIQISRHQTVDDVVPCEPISQQPTPVYERDYINALKYICISYEISQRSLVIVFNTRHRHPHPESSTGWYVPLLLFYINYCPNVTLHRFKAIPLYKMPQFTCNAT